MGEKLNVAFLFGAGAEGKGNFEISTGFEFIKAVITSEKMKGLKDSLHKFFDMKPSNGSINYSKHEFDFYNFALRQCLVCKSIDDIEWYKANNQLLRSILNSEQLEEISENYKANNIELACSSIKDNIDEKGMVSYWKNQLNNNSDTNSNLDEEIKNLIDSLLENTESVYSIGLAGCMEPYFHTVLNPKKYGKIRFAKLVNYYWKCYFVVLTDIVNYLKEANKDLCKYYDEKSKELKYDDILNNLSDFTNKLYAADIKNAESSYYNLIKERINGSRYTCSGVATTNYYKFCEVLCEEPIFLNGELRLFEFPDTLEVLDAGDVSFNEQSPNRLFFPFIFGQTMVKPIVSSVQVEAFHRFKKVLEKSDCLVVLGYGINDDDAHVNAFIRDFVNNGKFLIVVGNNKEDAGQVCKKIRCRNEFADMIHYIEFDEKNNNMTVDKLFRELYGIQN